MRLAAVLALSCTAVLAVGTGIADAQGGAGGGGGGTAKPPPGAAAPFVEPTLGDPAFSVPATKIHGFDTTGYIQAATVDRTMKDSSGAVCANPGGTVTVNNTPITVPCNLTIQMPANTFTWDQFLSSGPDLTLNGGKPSPAFEIRVVGNLVDTKRIAGLMFFSQESMNAGDGYIAAINYADGSFTLDSGTKVQLNDPKITTPGDPAVGTGRYSAGQSPDARLSVDQGNPTVLAGTGYPMCIPRTDPAAADDPLCPKINRPLVTAPAQPGPATAGVSVGCRNFSVAGVVPPKGGELAPPVAGQVYCSQFVMKDPAAAPKVGGVRAATDPDSRQQVPFEVGDHVSYAGTLVGSGATAYISAHTVKDDIGVFTQPGSTPSYISIDTALIGTADPLAVAVSGVAQETQDRLVLEALTTDLTAPVDGYIVDINPTTGSVRNRWVTPFEMTGENQAGVPTGGITTQVSGAQPQRARLRATKAPAGLLSDPSRTLRVSSRNTCTPSAASGVNQSAANSPSTAVATPVDACLNNLKTAANGLQAGEYTAPMFDFVFPENVQPGTPIVPNDLWHLGFLRFGEGANPITPAVGPLTPAPW